MFYVYGTDGRQFAGTLETLLSNRKVESLGGIKPLRNEGSPGQNAGTDSTSSGKQGARAGESEAVSAYRTAIQLQKQIGPLLHAYQIMTSPVISVDAEAEVETAWKVLQEKDIRHLPITASLAQGGPVLAGMISESDFYRSAALPSEQEDRAGMPISSLMNTTVYSADPMTDIRRIAQLMFEKHIGCMPIVGEEGSLDGIITRGDILRALVNHPSFNLWA